MSKYNAVAAFHATLEQAKTMVEDAAIALSQVPAYGWIATKDALPLSGMRVLLWNADLNDVAFGSFNESGTWGKYGSDRSKWPLESLIWSIYPYEGKHNVSHWMPIVPPPKEAPKPEVPIGPGCQMCGGQRWVHNYGGEGVPCPACAPTYGGGT